MAELPSAGESVSPAPSAAIGAKSRLYRSPSTVSMSRPCWVVVSARVSPSELGPHDRSGVVISNDLPTNGSRFLVIHNGREIDVHIAIPLADPAVHGSKVIRLDNRYAGATDLSCQRPSSFPPAGMLFARSCGDIELHRLYTAIQLS